VLSLKLVGTVVATYFDEEGALQAWVNSALMDTRPNASAPMSMLSLAWIASCLSEDPRNFLMPLQWRSC
jgi:hypothetical protein